MRTYAECGCCGYYHEKGYDGDCRNDEMRLTLEEIMEDIAGGTPDVTIIPLDDQNDDDGNRRDENGLIDENDDPVYCSASGCEAQAWEVVGESQIPLCGVCADIWYMGFEAGFEAGKEAAKE